MGYVGSQDIGERHVQIDDGFSLFNRVLVEINAFKFNRSGWVASSLTGLPQNPVLGWVGTS